MVSQVGQRSPAVSGFTQDGLRRLGSESTAKDRELGKGCLLACREQGPRMLENSPQAAMCLGRVAIRHGEKIQIKFDLCGDLGAGVMPHPG